MQLLEQEEVVQLCERLKQILMVALPRPPALHMPTHTLPVVASRCTPEHTAHGVTP